MIICYVSRYTVWLFFNKFDDFIALFLACVSLCFIFSNIWTIIFFFCVFGESDSTICCFCGCHCWFLVSFVVYDFWLWVLLQDFPFCRSWAGLNYSGQPTFLQTWEWTQSGCNYSLWAKPWPDSRPVSSCSVLGKTSSLRFLDLCSRGTSCEGLCPGNLDKWRSTWDLSVEPCSTCSWRAGKYVLATEDFK